MKDARMTKLADVLVNYSVGVKPGDWVIIQGDMLTAPLFGNMENVQRTLPSADRFMKVVKRSPLAACTIPIFLGSTWDRFLVFSVPIRLIITSAS